MEVSTRHLPNHSPAHSNFPQGEELGDLAALFSISATNYKPPRGRRESVTHVLGQQKCSRSQGSPFLVDSTHSLSPSPPIQRGSPFLAPAEAPVASQAPGSPELLPLASSQVINGVLEKDLLRNKPTFHSPLPASISSWPQGQRPCPCPCPQASGLYHRFLVTASGGTIGKTLCDQKMCLWNTL